MIFQHSFRLILSLVLTQCTLVYETTFFLLLFGLHLEISSNLRVCVCVRKSDALERRDEKKETKCLRVASESADCMRQKINFV